MVFGSNNSKETDGRYLHVYVPNSKSSVCIYEGVDSDNTFDNNFPEK